MKLFAFYVGGSTATSNTEVHDMRFAIGEQMEDCYESLRRQWWGTPESLHVDCWRELTSADGHQVTLRRERSPDTNLLFFVNLGGYDPGLFTELHRDVFVVAKDKDTAKKRAVAMVRGWLRPHRDKLFEVEHIIGLCELAELAGLHIHLESAPGIKSPPFVTGCYTKLGV
jgi:hypothetical protein